jgi:hypothetical protein
LANTVKLFKRSGFMMLPESDIENWEMGFHYIKILSMSQDNIDILVVSPQLPALMEALEKRYSVHKLWLAEVPTP